jgi:signal transduction histidine kinase
VGKWASLCQDDPVVHAVLEAADGYAVVLNPERQILAANAALTEALGPQEGTACVGVRLGEALGCVRATQGPEGCGTAAACRHCGALLSVLATQASGEKASNECLLSLRRDGRYVAREFSAKAVPLRVAGQPLTYLSLRDISAQKRLDRLERVFIHDLSASLAGLKAGSEMMRQAGADATAIAERVLLLADQLKAEVDYKRCLVLAENGELAADLHPVTPAFVFSELSALLGPVAMAKVVQVAPPRDAGFLTTDTALLCRVLLNMVQNAIEAMPPGGQAHLHYELREDRPTFVVHNPGCMQAHVADRVFQRSFSTKAVRGRGLGTYGMKLLGETVLGGTVGFTTSWEEGTCFFIELPAEN